MTPEEANMTPLLDYVSGLVLIFRKWKQEKVDNTNVNANAA